MYSEAVMFGLNGVHHTPLASEGQASIFKNCSIVWHNVGTISTYTEAVMSGLNGVHHSYWLHSVDGVTSSIQLVNVLIWYCL